MGFLDHVSLSVRAGHGGLDVTTSPSALDAGVGLSADFGGVRACASFAAGSVEYNFRSRFFVDRGQVHDRARTFGFTLSGTMLRSGAARLDWSASARFARRRWEMNGRRLIVGNDVSVEVVHRIDHSYTLAGGARVTGLWRGIALSTGVEKRPRLSDGLLVFVELSGLAIRLAN